jgi:hypothetical protein
MKFMRTISFSLLAACLTGAVALAQPGNRVPGPTDYAAFSQFITDRNIFDPNRQPHFTSSRPRASTRPTAHSAPAFSLVGTMAYEKGMFAFFNGNSEDLKRALAVSGQIAGYTVTGIEYGRVTLETTNQAQKVELNVGDVMREENGAWQLAGPGDLPVTGSSGDQSGTNRSAASSTTVNTGTGSSPAPSAAEANDILKRLMEKRKQENQ